MSNQQKLAKKRWLAQGILALTLVIIGTFAYWLEYSHNPKQEEAERLSKKLFPIKETSVSEVAVKDPNQTFSFKCDEENKKECRPGSQAKWEVMEPTVLKADKGNVNALLSSLNNLRASEVLDFSGDSPERRAQLMTEFGLSEAGPTSNMRQISVKGEDGKTIVAYFGNSSPIGNKIYSVVSVDGQVDDGKVFMVPGYFKSNFEHDLTYWRDKKIFNFTVSDVESFDYSGSKAKIGAKKEEGKWFLTFKKRGKNQTVPGDIENVDSLLRAATFLKAKSFVADNNTGPKASKILRGAKQIIKFKINRKEQGPVLFEVLEKTEEKKSTLYAISSELQPLIELEASAKNRLDKKLQDLRLAKLITSLERFTAKRLAFDGAPLGGVGITLQQEDSKWHVENNKGEKVVQEKVSKLLDRLSGRRIKDYLEGKEIPEGEADGLTVILGDEKEAEKRRLVFWKKGDELFAKDLGSGSKEAFRVDKVLTDALPWTHDFFSKSDKPPADPKKADGKG